MTSAAEALLLPNARLSDKEQEAAALLADEIEQYIAEHMEYGGCQGFKTPETNGNVIAEVNQRLRRKNWLTHWRPTHVAVGEKQPPVQLVGWTLDLVPRDEAYEEAKAREEGRP